jgi:hypothetical protein
MSRWQWLPVILRFSGKTMMFQILGSPFLVATPSQLGPLVDSSTDRGRSQEKGTTGTSIPYCTNYCRTGKTKESILL